MEVHPLMEEPFVVAYPRGRLTGEGDVLAQLRCLPLIQYTERHHMGHQIASHLARQNLRLDHRFELDSYHAIMAMVAAGVGWTILTPLGYFCAQRFSGATELMALPFAPLTRRISLIARRDVLGDMPGEVAVELKRLLAELIVAPALKKHAFLQGELRLL